MDRTRMRAQGRGRRGRRGTQAAAVWLVDHRQGRPGRRRGYLNTARLLHDALPPPRCLAAPAPPTPFPSRGEPGQPGPSGSGRRARRVSRANKGLGVRTRPGPQGSRRRGSRLVEDSPGPVRALGPEWATLGGDRTPKARCPAVLVAVEVLAVRGRCQLGQGRRAAPGPHGTRYALHPCVARG